MKSLANNSDIRDNHRRGVVADFLKAKIQTGSRLSVVSAYFTIYAYEALKDRLDQIEHLDFLFGEPRFTAHPAGGSKASFFLRFGFTVADWPRLAGALLRHALENEVVETEQTRHGTRYAVDGPLLAPDGTILNVRSAWYIDPGSDAPRFVTAHPLPKL